jgi:hypothetical protein
MNRDLSLDLEDAILALNIALPLLYIIRLEVFVVF